LRNPTSFTSGTGARGATSPLIRALRDFGLLDGTSEPAWSRIRSRPTASSGSAASRRCRGRASASTHRRSRAASRTPSSPSPPSAHPTTSRCWSCAGPRH